MRALCFCLCLIAPPALGQGIEIYGETTASLSGDLSVEGYLEASRNGAYAGIWTLAGPYPEIDLYAGLHGSIAAVDYDFIYTRYVYPGEGGGDEISLSLGKTMGAFDLDVDLTYDPETALGSVLTEVEFDTLDTSVSASFGLYQIEDARPEREWGLSVEHSLSDRLSAQITLADGNALPGTFTLSLEWESR